MKLIAAVLLVLEVLPASAADTLPLSAPPPSSAALGATVNFRPAGGYHFNLKAPQECGAEEAVNLTKSSLDCRFTTPGAQEVSLKVCDDKESECLFADFTVTVAGPAGTESKAAAAAPDKERPLEGFLLNAPAQALEQAKKEGKPLFIDFFGRWCPPCRLMEDTVLWQPSFLDATRGMVRLSLDVDRPESREWRRLFGVNSYPTYLVADARLREIGRWTGNASLTVFNAWIAQQDRWKETPLAGLESDGATPTEAGRLRLARQNLVLENWDKVRAALAGLGGREAACLDAQAQAKQAENSTDTAKLSALYSGLLARFDGRDGQPAVPAALDWLAALQKADPAAAKPYVEGLDALVDRLLASSAAADEGYGPEDIVYGAAAAMSDAGLDGEAKRLYARAAGLYRDLAGKAPRPELAKGLRLSQARCLSGAGRYDEAAAVLAALAAEFPSEYAFHRSYAAALLKLKKYPEALKEAQAAERLSYGDIHSQIVVLEARILAASGDKPGAVSALEGAIASAEASGDAAGSLRQYLGELRKAE